MSGFASKDLGKTEDYNQPMTANDVKKMEIMYGCKVSTTAPPVTTPAPCENKHVSDTDCDRWAGYGYCKKSYVEWMTKNCAKSCNTCCNDEDQTLCSKINKNNATYYCSNPHIASLAQYPEKCKRTCGKCDGDCQDKKPLPWCQDKKAKNRCNKKSTYTKCRNTCEKC